MAENLRAKQEVAKLEKKLSLEFGQLTRTKSILNANQVQKILNTTPRNYRYTRPAKGGGTWTYVRKGYVRRSLDSIFGFNWDFEIDTSVSEAFEVAKLTGTCVVKGTIVARVLNDRQEIMATLKKTDFGRAEVKKKQSGELLDFGNDMKAAASDCLKRCAAQFGIAADVYDPLEFQEIEIKEADQHSARNENIERMTADAQKVLEAQSTKVGEENGK